MSSFFMTKMNCPQFSYSGFHFLPLKLSEQRCWASWRLCSVAWARREHCQCSRSKLCPRNLGKPLLEPSLPGGQGISLYQQ